MSNHPNSFKAEKPVPLAEAVPPSIGAELASSRRPLWRRLALAGVGLAALTAAADYSWGYWTAGRFQVSTDDAYIRADSTTIAPKISGYVAAVLVADNEPVKPGQIL